VYENWLLPRESDVDLKSLLSEIFPLAEETVLGPGGYPYPGELV
jgi:hypothetical protein